MAAAAAAAAAVNPTLEAAFQNTCEAVAGQSIAVLDEKQPERDWPRWMQALMDIVATKPMFKATSSRPSWNLLGIYRRTDCSNRTHSSTACKR